MAKRHEIQNLVRRDHIYYWRPRIPRRFIKACDSHLSLSLHQSCHMKASYMARRLNTLLHEMQMKPAAALTTKDQLEALFRTEAARMAEHLDNLQFAARRVGADPLLALRADLEVGWAYRLIELFGTMRRLDFGPECPGRKVLEREGIPETSIKVIAETFAQEQAEYRRTPFEKACATIWPSTASQTPSSTASAPPPNSCAPARTCCSHRLSATRRPRGSDWRIFSGPTKFVQKVRLPLPPSRRRSQFTGLSDSWALLPRPSHRNCGM